MKSVGDYTIERELARGGAGVVYLARDPRGHRVALKLLLEARADARKRFLREAQALRRLDHPHVIRVREAGEAGGRAFLAMDYVEGSTLAQRLERGGPFPPRRAAEVARALADALAHAHARGLLHRDVKPDNVLLDAAGEPRLTDFGLTRDVDPSLDQTRLSKTGVFLGTPGYWPPEQAHGRLDAVGPWSDVYGLGATLYALLTGAPPHDVSSLTRALDHVDRHAPPPSRANPAVPPGLDAICRRALEPDPQARYPDAGAMAAALDAHLAAPPSSPSRAPAWIAAALVLAGAGAAASVVTRSQAGPPASSPVTGSVGEPAHVEQQLEAVWRGVLGHQAWAGLEAALATILAERPDHPGAAACLGALRFEQLRVEEGTRLLRDALQAAPSDPFVLLAAAHVHGKIQDEPLGAVVYLDRVFAARPRLQVAWVLLAAVRHSIGEREATRAAARAALELRDEPLARIYLALADPDPEAALATIDAALSAQPNHALGCVVSAGLLAAEGREDDALAAYARAFDRPPATVHMFLEARAGLYVRRGRTELAIADLERAAAQFPRADEQRKLAFALTRGGRVDAAGAALEAALRLDPADVSARASWSEHQRWVSGPRAALQALLPALAANPDDPEVRLQRGLLRLEVGDRDAALDDLRAANRDLASIWIQRGVTVLEQAAATHPLRLPPLDLEAALAHGERWLPEPDYAGWARLGYARALELHPDHPRALAGLAVLAARCGDPTRARALLERVRDLDPRQATLRAAQVAVYLGGAPEALRATAALGLDAESGRIRAQALLELDAYQQAHDVLREAYPPGTPRDTDSLLLEARAFLGLDRPENARRVLELARASDPNDIRPDLWLARAWLVSHQLPRALDAIERHLARAPDGAAYPAHVLRASISEHVALQPERRLAIGQAAIERGGFLGPAYLARARARIGLGELPRALPDLELAAGLDPFRVDARSARAEALRHADEGRLALIEADAALQLRRRRGAPELAILRDEIERAWCLLAAGYLAEARAERERLWEACRGHAKLLSELEVLRLELERAQ